jgi:hypothetical protein
MVVLWKFACRQVTVSALWDDMVFSDFRGWIPASKHHPISYLMKFIVFAMVDIKIVPE